MQLTTVEAGGSGTTATLFDLITEKKKRSIEPIAIGRWSAGIDKKTGGKPREKWMSGEKKNKCYKTDYN